MKQFVNLTPQTLDQAVSLLQKNSGAAVVAGGTELLHTLKQSNLPIQPTVLVDLKSIPGLDYIKVEGGVLKIGPNTKLVTIANSTTVQGNYAALAQAAGKVASPLIRNMGTIAGNICQDVWCWYYKGTDNLYNCIRKGGAVCFAQAGDNRWYHSIFGGPKGCYSVTPTDTGVALSALNASVVTTKQTLTMDKFFTETAPAHTLAADEVVKEIQVPTPAAGSKSAFVKLAIRDSIDFSLASAAVWFTPATGAVTDCRIFLGGVYQTPRRATGAETYLKGKTVSTDVAAATGLQAVADATPMTGNSFKKQWAAVAVQRALTS